MGMEDIGEERLVEPHRAQRAGAIAQQHLEDLEARPSRWLDAAADRAEHRRHHARTQRGNGPERTAILVTGGKAIEQVFDGCEPDALQIGGTPGPTPFRY